jgi:hypothetical protein
VNLIVAERLVAWIDQGLDERLSLNGITSEWSDGCGWAVGRHGPSSTARWA